ncbi:MAG TPA: hypothetical protein VKC90_00090 [Chitinophagaceae bacterium]|nr:hypothetical protein [Chitinophagaceae bacterium]
MKKIFYHSTIGLFSIVMITYTISSCQKSVIEPASNLNQEIASATNDNAPTPAQPNFNLEVILRNEADGFGHVKFRQDNDIDKIVMLDTWVRNLKPNHEYKLQRAVDTNLDGNCTGTAWLTLGKGLVAQSIFTDESGTGSEQLFRNLSAFASGMTFDIHFQIIDAETSAVVLTSDCYQFTIR